MKEINLQEPMDEYFLSSTPTIQIFLLLGFILYHLIKLKKKKRDRGTMKSKPHN